MMQASHHSFQNNTAGEDKRLNSNVVSSVAIHLTTKKICANIGGPCTRVTNVGHVKHVIRCTCQHARNSSTFGACHKKDPHMEPPFICDICGKQKPNFIKLKEHLWSHKKTQLKLESGTKSGPVEKVSCEVCGKVVNKKTLHKHVKHHLKPLFCDQCTERFADQRSLNHHKLRKHKRHHQG